jgi:hypothetical protein
MPSNRRAFPPKREFPRDVMLKLPSAEECCTVAETVFWNQTMQLAQGGARPRVVAEFAAHGLDDPLLVRAYPTIRAAMNKWAEMGEVWQDYDQPGILTPVQIKTEESWYEPAELWPTT